MTRLKRLTSSHDFTGIFREGSRSSVDPIACAARQRAEQTEPHFGFVVSRRIGGAVTRNKVKRLLREAARAIAPKVRPQAQVVVVAKPSIVGKSFQTIRAALDEAIEKAGAAC